MTRPSTLVLYLICVAALIPAAGHAQLAPCDDLAGIDFGLCEALLGWGMLDGSCQAISGCPPSPVPLFASQAACEEACVPSPNCDDLAQIDFGDCDAVLGVGMIGGNCTVISGCESPVPLFNSMGACQAECASVDASSVTWSIVKSRYKG